MSAIAALLRIFSYLFHGLLSLLALALAVLALLSGPQALYLPVLPWTGSTLAYTLLGASLFGLLSVALALFGKLRPLFLLWSLAVPYFLFRGYIFSGYRFAPGEMRIALYLIGGSLLALAGAWSQFRAKPSAKIREYRTR